MLLWTHIIHAAERAFVKGVRTPSITLETMISVHFPIDVAKQMKRMLKN